MNKVPSLLLLTSFVLLGSCQSSGQDNTRPTTSKSAIEQVSQTNVDVFAAQPAEFKARYQYRNPKQTLEFMGIKPGMTVVEYFPGRNGWYTQLLMPYLGSKGTLIGADYPLGVWQQFRSSTPESLEQRATWATDWVSEKQRQSSADSPAIDAFVLGSMPDSLKASADAVFIARALHNLARYEAHGSFLTSALKNSYDILKPGGIVGIVQHRAAESMPDDWADGSNGYLKPSFVIEAMQKAGFQLIAQSEINANPKDQPTIDDFVWRLPPVLSGAKQNLEKKAAMQAIGESDRMTLVFVKP